MIGAGTSGLTAIKNLRAAGFRVDCLERESDLGGNWNIALQTSRVMRSTRLISSKELTEYVDHPMPEAWTEYPGQAQVLEYLRSYAERFDLESSIEYGATIRDAQPLDHEGGWLVTLETGERRRYGRLVIANGHNWDYAFPAWSGRAGGGAPPFTGLELHSGECRSSDVFAGKRVLVVGGGNSGCDVAVEASRHATSTRLSLRRGYHFLPKFFHGAPIDACGERMLRWGFPLPLRRQLARAMAYFLLGSRVGTGLPKPDHRLFETHPTINSELIYQLRHGALAIRPDVERLTESGVRFVDGREEPFDVIVCATGYKLSFPFVDHQWLNWRDGRPDLYLNVFHPERDDLFVLGMIQPDSGQWGLVDRQARLVARYLVGLEQSSSRADRFRSEKRGDDRVRRIGYVDTPRHRLEVEHFSYRKRLDREWRRLGKGLEAAPRGEIDTKGAPMIVIERPRDAAVSDQQSAISLSRRR